MQWSQLKGNGATLAWEERGEGIYYTLTQHPKVPQCTIFWKLADRVRVLAVRVRVLCVRARACVCAARARVCVCMFTFVCRPDEAAAGAECVVGFQSVVREYYTACEAFARSLTCAMTAGLGMSAESLVAKHFDASHSSYLRLNYYPPCPNPDEHNAISHHTDAGVSTSTNARLQVSPPLTTRIKPLCCV